MFQSDWFVQYVCMALRISEVFNKKILPIIIDELMNRFLSRSMLNHARGLVASMLSSNGTL